MIDRDWRTYLDRKVVHFAYFYVLWVTIQFGFKAPSFAAESGWAHVGLMYLQSFIEPFGTLWFIYLLPIFFVVTKVTRRMPPLAIWAVAALLEMAHISTGWTVIDEFAARFVYFYSGYWLAATCSRWSDRARARPGWALAGLALWALVNGGLVELDVSEWPLVSLALGFAGALRHRHHGHAAGAHAVAELPALLRRAFHRHLSRLLPADGGDADAAAEDRLDPRHRNDLADRHGRRRRRRDRDLAGRAQRPAPISCSNARPHSGSRRRRRSRRCRRRSRFSLLVVPATQPTPRRIICGRPSDAVR